MIKENLTLKKVGEIVANDFRSAAIFKNAGIDFCCGGNQVLEQACLEKRIDITIIEKELHALENSEIDSSVNFNEWDIDFLCDYIVNNHHKTVLKLLPLLSFYNQKIAEVHGGHHPELIEIARLFSQVNTELLQHLKNEEKVLFPAIKDVLKTNSAKSKETIISEINRMKQEHEFAGDTIDKINVLSGNYKVPEDGCATYHVTFKLLKQFEDDLRIHVHLENNILYPKAVKIGNTIKN